MKIKEIEKFLNQIICQTDELFLTSLSESIYKKFIEYFSYLKDKKILIIFNSQNQIDIFKIVNYLIDSNNQIYTIKRKTKNKFKYHLLKDLSYKIEYYKNINQIASDDKGLSNIEFDFIITPSLAFDMNLNTLDYESNLNLSIIKTNKNAKIITYGYSIQLYDLSHIKNVYKSDYILTNNFVINKIEK